METRPHTGSFAHGEKKHLGPISSTPSFFCFAFTFLFPQYFPLNRPFLLSLHVRLLLRLIVSLPELLICFYWRLNSWRLSKPSPSRLRVGLKPFRFIELGPIALALRSLPLFTMKMHLSSPLILALFPVIATVVADITYYNKELPSRVPPESRDMSYTNSRLADADSIVPINAASRGTLDVPVDGKDGRPHAGPWVETSAERDRKSSRSSDGIDLVSSKYDVKIPSSEYLSTEDGRTIPHSNGGVMDDPHRVGPKEGTRGTEGGVSEKGKDNLLYLEKVPGKPKEAPPLPQSEQRKLSSSEGTDGSWSRSADGTGNLGVLEVCRILIYPQAIHSWS